MPDAESKVTLRPRSKLERILDGLEDSYGVPARPNLDLTTQVALLLLVGAGADGRTAVSVIKPLCAKSGAVDPSKLATTPRELVAGIQTGSQLDDTVAALRALGDAALATPSLEDRCRADAADARRALRALGLGEQRADLLLLQAGLHPLVAPSASAMQVAVRVGYPGTGYGSFARVLDQELPDQYAIAVAWRAHHLLDQHARSICTLKAPQCGRCPIRDACAYRGEGEDPAGRLSWRAPPAES